jgi:hypothetical protein
MKPSLILLFFVCCSMFVQAQGPATWNQNTAYTHPALVLNGSTTYISVQDVPSGTAITSTAYWDTLDSQVPTTTPSGAESLTTPDASEVSSLSVPDSDSSTTTASGLTTASNEAFVMQQYLDFLGRDGDADGIAYWANLIANGTIYRADVVDFFVSSAEFQAVIAPVSRLYLAYFKRLPDTDGLNHWIELKLNGMALNDMSQHFSDSTEFQSSYGNLSNEDFVKLVYQNVLGREADAGGLNYWTGLLDGGTLNRGSVMTEFSESAENTNLTNNNIRVISFYYGMLGRAPDLDGYNYWVQQFENGVAANALLNAFYLGTEYQGRANISAAVGGFGK